MKKERDPLGYPLPVGLMCNFDLDEATGCWNWKGAKDADGYGVMMFRGKRQKVHRIAAFLWLGLDKSPELYALHRCDNPSCFNPKHLFLGTNTDNMLDASSKKRLRNQKNTHCIHGHEFTPENTYFSGRTRHCLSCLRIRDAKRSDLRRLHVI